MYSYNKKITLSKNKIVIRDYNNSFNSSLNIKKYANNNKYVCVKNSNYKTIKKVIRNLTVLYNKLNKSNKKDDLTKTKLNNLKFNILYARYISHTDNSNAATSFDKEISVRSRKRTYKNTIDTIENNKDKFNSFITLTFKNNITNLDFALYLFKKYIIDIKRELEKDNMELFYICVPELQKRGAIHFHMLTNVPCDSVLIPKQDKVLKLINSDKSTKFIEYYSLKHWDYGFSSAMPVLKNESFNVALYMAKYMSKESEEQFFGRRKVLKSKNLDKPIVFKESSQNFPLNIDKMLHNKLTHAYMYGSTNDFDCDFCEYTYKINDSEYKILKNSLSHIDDINKLNSILMTIKNDK